MTKLTSIVLALMLISLSAEKPKAKTYEAIKGESSLSYTLIHPLHQIQGISHDFICQVDLSSDTVSSKVRVSALISSFDTKNASRDSHAMEMVDALKYPRVEFSSDSVKADSIGYQVFGQLNFHGISRPINFRIIPKFIPGKVQILGEFMIKLSDFKVKRPTLLFIPTEDKITIRFDLVSEVEKN